MIYPRQETYRIKAEIITPVHIGDGTDLGPLEYIIRDRFYKICLEDWLPTLADEKKKEFKRFIGKDYAEKNTLTALRRFVKNNLDVENYTEWIADATNSVLQRYTERFDKPENQLQVSPFIRSAGKPYLPGSSIKGALRTAYLNHLAKEHSFRERKNSNIAEGELLKALSEGRDGKLRFNIDSDPFRAVKVKDIFLPSGAACFAEIVNYNKKSGRLEPTSIQILSEVTYGKLFVRPVSFNLEVIVDKKILNHTKSGLVGHSTAISIDNLLKACDCHYRKALETECAILLDGVNNKEWLKKIYDEILKYAHGGCLFRLGLGSGLISMTIDKLRPSKGYGNSKNLVEGKWPLGWMVLKIDKKKTE